MIFIIYKCWSYIIHSNNFHNVELQKGRKCLLKSFRCEIYMLRNHVVKIIIGKAYQSWQTWIQEPMESQYNREFPWSIFIWWKRHYSNRCDVKESGIRTAINRVRVQLAHLWFQSKDVNSTNIPVLPRQLVQEVPNVWFSGAPVEILLNFIFS